MQTQVVEHLKSSLTDVRCVGTILDLEALLERKEFDDEVIPQYRVYIEGTDTPVTSVADVISNIDVGECEISSYTGKGSSISHTLSPVMVTLNNLEVRTDIRFDIDHEVVSTFGRYGKRISFLLGYCNDNDTTLPLKVLGLVVGR